MHTERRALVHAAASIPFCLRCKEYDLRKRLRASLSSALVVRCVPLATACEVARRRSTVLPDIHPIAVRLVRRRSVVRGRRSCRLPSREHGREPGTRAARVRGRTLRSKASCDLLAQGDGMQE